MAAKKRRRKTGPRGPRGKQGPAGPPGPPANHTKALAALAEHVDQIARELAVQLTRIGQIQAQLDRLASGLPPEALERRRTPRTQH